MNLVEQFIEQHTWPTARKTLWLMGVVACFQVFVFPTSWLLLRDTGIVDMHWFTWLLVAGMAATVVPVVDGWLALRGNRDGRWTAYVVVLMYGTFLQVAIYAFGTWSSFWLFFQPLTVFLCAVWYDATISTFALFYSVALVTTFTVLALTDVLPYAPALLDRGFDAQDSVPWVLGHGTLFGAGLVVCFGLGILAALGRDRQEQRLQAAFGLIRRYVPGQVADELLEGAGGGVERSSHERRRLTVFFSDLVGFTDICDDLEPEDLARVLNDYFTEMTTIAQRYGGTVDELSGDAILVLFGAPRATNDRDHALRAVHMAVDMQAAVAELNSRWRSDGLADELTVRMGINTGVVTVGNFGSLERVKYAALGKNVNVAARLQAHCKPGMILLSNTTWLLVRKDVECREVGEVQLKGLHMPVSTYEVLVPAN